MIVSYVLPIILIANDVGLVFSSRILGIYPVGCRSTFMVHQKLISILLGRGHDVTVMSKFPQTQKTLNYTDFDVSEDLIGFDGTTRINDVSSSGLANLKLSFDTITTECRQIYGNRKVKELLRSGTKFDLVMLELDGTECFLPLAFALSDSVVGIQTNILPFPDVDWMTGNPVNPAWLPTSLGGLPLKMDFLQRVLNTLHYVMFFAYRIIYNHYSNTIVAEYFGKSSPIEELFDRVSVVFTYNHPSLISRPLAPNTVGISGVHINERRPIPDDIKRFINGSKNGVIYVSFGTTVKFSTMSKRQHDVFVSVLSSLPYQILWKHDKPELVENVSKNILLKTWFPQADVLAEDEVVLFISHCGSLGMYESIYNGKPILCVPIYYDQTTNAAILQDLEVGFTISHRTIDEKLLRSSIDEILTNHKYRKNVVNLSKKFRDRPMAPNDTFIYWIEYVIRHREAPHLHPVGRELWFFQHFLMDVILFLIVVFLSMCLIFKTVFRSLIRKKKKEKRN